MRTPGMSVIVMEDTDSELGGLTGFIGTVKEDSLSEILNVFLTGFRT